MTRVHDHESIVAVCRELAERDGDDGLTRTAVQAALRERSEQAGGPRAGADNAVVSAAIRQVREERRQARIASSAAAAGGDAGELPELLSTVLARSVADVERACRVAFTEERERAVLDARQRVRLAEEEATAQRAVLEADLLIVQRESAELAAELDAARQLVEDQEARLAKAGAALDERSAALQDLERAVREQVSALEEDVRTAHAGRLTAEQRFHEAELRMTDTVGTLSRLQERYAVLEADRDRWRETAMRHEARAAEAERGRDEGRGRLTAAEAECTRLREELAKARSVPAVALPAPAAPRAGKASVRHKSGAGPESSANA